MERPHRAWLLPSEELPWWRRGLVALALVPALGCFNELLSELTIAVGLLVPLGLIHVDRTWAQLLVRACLWSTLLLGMRLVAEPFGAPAVAIALLALGGAGLADREGDDHRPRAYRTLLQALVLVAGIELVLLVVRLPFALRDFSPWMADHPRRVAFELLWPLLLGAALVGSYRLRVWGLTDGRALHCLGREARAEERRRA